MTTLRLDQDYVTNVLIPGYAAVAFQTECGGILSKITSFHIAGGDSTYSFGIFQFNVGSNPDAKDFLADPSVGFTPDELSKLSGTTD